MKATYLLACFMMSALSCQLRAESPAATTPSDKRPAWKQYCEMSLREFRLTRKPDPTTRKVDEPFELIDHALFVHLDTVESDEHGLLYAWKNKDGRPVAVITSVLMRWPDPKNWSELHEYHSLTDEPLEMRRDDEVVWTPPRGLDWKELPEAPSPAKSKVRLQSQAKLLSKQFTVQATDPDGKDWRFRLITKPIYSFAYKDEKGQLRGGSLLIFCRATDPEVLLMLEVRKNKQGNAVWHYGVGNFTHMRSHLILDGKTVWTSPGLGPDQPHGTSFQVNVDYKARLIEFKSKAKPSTP